MKLNGVIEPSVINRYEARRLDETKLECYRATSSRFSEADFGKQIYMPTIDQQRIAIDKVRPSWPQSAPFAVCLTHDVDNVAWHSPRIHSRSMVSQARHLLNNTIERRALGALKSSMTSLVGSLVKGHRPDPLHCYEQWLEIEAEFNAKSTFLFLPDVYDQPHYSDGGYRYSDLIRFDGARCTVAEMIREIHDRGWEIGLHPSWHTYCNASTLRRDKECLEAVIQAPVVSARQHFLHFDIRCTPQAYQDAGLLYDSSLGFNDDVGFRSGTCWPFELADWQSQSRVQVTELPLVIQDKCLTKIVGQGDAQRSLDLGMEIADRVEAVGGVLTLLWHPRLINDPLSMEVYHGLLDGLKRRGAWFGTMQEVGKWWAKECVQWT